MRFRHGAVSALLTLTTLTCVHSASAQNGLVAAYGFNEGSGTTTTDASGNANTGTLSGATWSTAGRYGGALAFDGTSAWVTVPDAAVLDLTTGMTLEAWVYASSVGAWRTVLMKETANGFSYGLDASDTNRRPSAWIRRTADIGATGTSAFPANSWVHLAATYNGSTLILYLNGSPVVTRAITGAIVTSSQPLRIGGAAPYVGENFAGRIDEVRIYNRALTASEIQTDMGTPIGSAQSAASSGPGSGTAVGIHFVGTGTSMGAAESAGVLPTTHWNNATGASRTTALALVDETGSPSSATVTWTSSNTWRTPITDQAGNPRLMRGYLNTTDTSVTTATVVGLPNAAYDVYVYADGDNATAARTSAYRISGAGITTTTINLTDAASTNFNATFTQAMNSAGNYVKFSIVAGGFTLTATPGASTGNKRAPVNAIQIIPTAASSPDFTIAATPGSQTVTQGGGTTYTVTTTAANGFGDIVDLTVTGLPASATATFTPASVAGAGDATMTVMTAANTPPGSSTLTITGTSGTLTRTTTATLVVNAAPIPDFTVSASPASRSVTQGSATSYSVTIGAVNGFSGTVNLSATGLPAGASATFTPATVTGTGTATLDVTTAADTPAGSSAVTITGTSGALTRTTTATLVVNAAPTADFTVSATPASRSVTQGGATTYSVTIAAVNGFSGTVNLSATGLPAGASATFTPATLTGTGTSTLDVTTAANTPMGTSTLNIAATSGSLSHGATVDLVIGAASVGPSVGIHFVGGGTSMGAAESAGVVPMSHWNNATGASRTTALALVDETGAASGATVAWTSNNTWQMPITDQAGNRRLMRGYLDTNDVSVTTVTVAGLPNAAYDVHVYADGDNAGVVKTGAYRISGAGITTTTINLTDAADTNFNATFTQATNSAGNYVKFSIVAGGFTLTATPGASTGNKRAPVNAIQIVPTTAASPDFTVSATPGSQTVTQGGGTPYTVTIAALNAFGDTVDLTVTGLPANATATFTPASVAGAGNATLNMMTAANTPPGSSTLTITGTSGALTRTTTATLVVNASPAPDFMVSATPGTRTVTQGNGTSYSVTVAAVNGFAGQVALSATGFPANASATFTPATVTAGGTSTLDVTTAANTPSGSSTPTITGTDGALTRTTTATLVVNAAPTADFTVSATPASRSVTQGGATTYLVTIGAVNGFSGTVNLSAAGLPAGAAATFTPATVTGSGTSTVDVTTAANTPPGSSTLVVTGTSGTITHSTSASLTVTGATYSISGVIAPAGDGAGTTVGLGGTSVASTTAGTGGSFSFAGLANGPYLVTPGKTGFTFSPSSRNVSVSSGDVTGVDFTAAQSANTISMSAPANGATVSSAFSMSATASASIVAVQFQVDNANAGPEDAGAPYSVSVTASNGAHTLRAIGRDASGTTVTSASVTVTVSGGSGTALAINGAQTFQTMDGMGVNINALSWKNGQLAPALDRLVDELGAKTWRVVFDMMDWESPNDNADPNTPNWTYYNALYSNAKFQNLWGTLRYLNQKGVTSGIMLSFMGRVPAWMGGPKITNTAMEDEWVEMVATLLYYARNTEQVEFDLLDPLNEPDWDGFEGPQVDQWQYPRVLQKLSVKLDAMGLGDLRFIGPNTAAIGTGVDTYIPELLKNSVAMSKLAHFGLHNYAGQTGGADARIKGSAYPTKNFWMTELSIPEQIFTMIGQGAAAAQIWDAYDSVYNHAILAGAFYNDGRGSTPPNDAGNLAALMSYNASSGVYAARPQFYQMQTFKYVMPGSIRIGASESNSSLTIYAFRHPTTGQVTVVGRNTGGSSITLNGSLSGVGSVGTLQFYQTSISNNYNSFTRGSDAVVTAGSFIVTVAANSYFTLTSTGQ